MKYENKAELIEKARALWEEGMSYYKITNELGVKGHDTIRIWLEPEIGEREYARRRQRYAEDEEYRKEINERNREYQAEHQDELIAYRKKNYQEHREESIKKSREWALANPERTHESQVRYRENNREKINERSRQWSADHRKECTESVMRWRDANGERYIEYTKQYYEDNRERENARARQWHADNKERSRENGRCYRTKHKDEYLAHARIRKAKIKSYDKILQEDYDAIFDKQNGLCAYCNKVMRIKGDPHHPDYKTMEHVYPFSRNGVHTLDNIVYACRECNLKKHTKTIAEWKPSLLPKIGNGVCGGEEMERVIEEL